MLELRADEAQPPRPGTIHKAVAVAPDGREDCIACEATAWLKPRPDTNQNAPLPRIGMLRLRMRFASRSSFLAQHDTFDSLRSLRMMAAGSDARKKPSLRPR